MQTKVDLPRLESYSIALSEKLCNDFYHGSTSVITGNEILKFTPIEQLNLFIIKNLFDRWKEETTKLRSPYFDYENEDMKDALNVFMNKLSRHISIRKEFFRPLVKKAISDTIAYILTPYDFIQAEFLNKPIVSVADVMEREKYVKVNKFIVQSLIKKMQLQNKTGFADHEVKAYFDEVYKNYESSLEPPARYIEAFSSILKVGISDLVYDSTKTPPVEKKQPEKESGKETAMFTLPQNDKNITDSGLTSVDKHATINDYFARNKQLTLNEMLVREQENNILTKHRKSKIHDLKTSVPLNLKYIFINELFRGGADDYNLALAQVERCEDFESAKNVLEQLYARKFEWDSEKTEVKEFYELVERRFY